VGLSPRVARPWHEKEEEKYQKMLHEPMGVMDEMPRETRSRRQGKISSSLAGSR